MDWDVANSVAIRFPNETKAFLLDPVLERAVWAGEGEVVRQEMPAVFD